MILLNMYIFHLIRALSYFGIMLAQIILLQLSGNDIFVQFNTLHTYAMFIWGAASIFTTYSILKTDQKINITNKFKICFTLFCIISIIIGKNAELMNCFLIILCGLVLKIDVINLKQEKRFVKADFSDFIVRSVGLHLGTIICLILFDFSVSLCILISLLVITLLSIRKTKPTKHFEDVKKVTFIRDKMLLIAICISMLDAPLFLMVQTKLDPNTDLQFYFIALQLIGLLMLPSIAASSYWQRHLKNLGKIPNFQYYIAAQRINFMKFLPLQIILFAILILFFAGLFPMTVMKRLDEVVYLKSLNMSMLLLVIPIAFVANLFGPIHHFMYFYYPNASMAIIYLASLLASIFFVYTSIATALYGVFIHMILWRVFSLLYFYHKTKGLHR